MTKKNYQLFALAMLTLVIGYIVMGIGPADGFLSLSLSPIILVIGYCVLIPLSIMYKEKKAE
ncbi:MAG: hypothetical protein KDD94_05145 [Calditrichaeota bacterium]|nr:hypothetical protein [Calditrichota bacterium]